MVDDLFDIVRAGVAGEGAAGEGAAGKGAAGEGAAGEGTDPPDIILRLHVQPGAGRTAVMGRHGDALKVKVAAPPAGGRANDACLALIAETLGVAAANLELTAGASSRSKRIRVRGLPTDDVRRALQRAVDQGNAGGSPGVRPGAR